MSNQLYIVFFLAQLYACYTLVNVIQLEIRFAFLEMKENIALFLFQIISLKIRTLIFSFKEKESVKKKEQKKMKRKIIRK